MDELIYDVHFGCNQGTLALWHHVRRSAYPSVGVA